MFIFLRSSFEQRKQFPKEATDRKSRASVRGFHHRPPKTLQRRKSAFPNVPPSSASRRTNKFRN